MEALRFLVHEAATVKGEEEEQEKVIMVNYVARAFFEAKAKASCVSSYQPNVPKLVVDTTLGCYDRVSTERETRP